MVGHARTMSDFVLSTIANNSCTGTTADGGAIRMAANSSLTLLNSTVSGNSSGDEGGGLYFLGNALSIVNSTFTGNLSRSNGAALRFRNITTALSIQNSSIVGNTARHLRVGVIGQESLCGTHVERRGQVVHDGGQQRLDALVLERRAAEHGNELQGDRALA